MQADPVVGGRLSQVLAEVQDVQLQQDECTVCMDLSCSVTLLPCGHRVNTPSVVRAHPSAVPGVSPGD
jgi:hypothetical protein